MQPFWQEQWVWVPGGATSCSATSPSRHPPGHGVRWGSACTRCMSAARFQPLWLPALRLGAQILGQTPWTEVKPDGIEKLVLLTLAEVGNRYLDPRPAPREGTRRVCSRSASPLPQSFGGKGGSSAPRARGAQPGSILRGCASGNLGGGEEGAMKHGRAVGLATLVEYQGGRWSAAR